MDPNESLSRVTRAMQSGALDGDALAAYDGYVEWTGKGGFPADTDVQGEFITARTAWDATSGEGAFQAAYRSFLADEGTEELY